MSLHYPPVRARRVEIKLDYEDAVYAGYRRESPNTTPVAAAWPRRHGAGGHRGDGDLGRSRRPLNRDHSSKRASLSLAAGSSLCRAVAPGSTFRPFRKGSSWSWRPAGISIEVFDTAIGGRLLLRRGIPTFDPASLPPSANGRSRLVAGLPHRGALDGGYTARTETRGSRRLVGGHRPRAASVEIGASDLC